MPSRRVGAFGVILFFLLTPSMPSPGAAEGSKKDVARQIRFGAEMARQGNWREAIFRWQRSLALDPDNPRLHNNLAVAYESLGEYEKADAEYKAALSSPQAPEEIRHNHELFLRFYGPHKERESGPEAGTANAPRESAGGAP